MAKTEGTKKLIGRSLGVTVGKTGREGKDDFFPPTGGPGSDYNTLTCGSAKEDYLLPNPLVWFEHNVSPVQALVLFCGKDKFWSCDDEVWICQPSLRSLHLATRPKETTEHDCLFFFFFEERKKERRPLLLFMMRCSMIMMCISPSVSECQILHTFCLWWDIGIRRCWVSCDVRFNFRYYILCVIISWPAGRPICLCWCSFAESPVCLLPLSPKPTQSVPFSVQAAFLFFFCCTRTTSMMHDEPID